MQVLAVALISLTNYKVAIYLLQFWFSHSNRSLDS